jgi:2-polyprenyl-3-methyl-5-hydroxy-6-metoxy-1,4-benzoquinol methylase
MRDRVRARELAAEFNKKGDPTGWFEQLYREGEAGKSVVPWADLRPNSHLLDFWKLHPLETAGKTALVIGSGFGDDAQQLAAWGFQTTAFDISETAIRAANKRFSTHEESARVPVKYEVANLLDPPSTWHRRFDFVLEIFTLQALPAAIRPIAIKNVAQFVSPGGFLLVIARGRELTDPEGQMPWPLTREELAAFATHGLTELLFHDYLDPDDPPERRFRVLYQLPHATHQA